MMSLFGVTLRLPSRWEVVVELWLQGIWHPTVGVLFASGRYCTSISLYLGWVGLDIIIERRPADGGL